ncbi:MAG TPA: TIGR03118 family protein [Rhizomicrobium sp.]|nr:TIGR03118 family protein [Rhizomicrobium sp.]
MRKSQFRTRQSDTSHFRILSVACAFAGGLAVASAQAAPISITNLITNDQSAQSAQITDPSLVNSWGISYLPTGPFWVSDNGTGVTTLYRIDPATNATTKLGLTVTIPGDGSITGQTANLNFGSGAFGGNLFVFVSEDGTISGWQSGTSATVLQSGSDADVYKGTTVASVGGHSYLYSANFRAGTIDILKGDVAASDLTGKFIDPNLPTGYAPFNVQNINGTIYVTYAVPNAEKKDDVPGLGNGIVDAFDTNGNLIGRIATGGSLDSPWGLAIAPAGFGDIAGDLLVGNFGDGTINIFDLSTDTFVGLLRDRNGNIVTIDGLWGLIAGNGTLAGNANSIYFSSGPGGESNGLFGVLAPAPEPWSMSLLLAGFGMLLFMHRRKAFA